MSIDVAVIGGGISGLALAYDLKRQGRRVVVLERQAHAGGNAVSERIGGFLMEHGPSTVNAASPVAADFSHELGLDAARCDLGAGVQQRYLVKRGALQGLPVHPLGMFTSSYLSPRARLRMLAEIAIPRRRDTNASGEESVAQFCTRRFGREFTERVMDPLIGGLYAGSAAELSVAAVFPKLVDLERRFGSITRGVMHRRRAGGRMPGSRLYSWRTGIGAMPKALSASLGGVVRTGIVVRRVQPVPGGFMVDAGSAGRLQARSVVLATQPHVAAQLLEDVDQGVAAAAGGIPAPPLAVVFLGYRRHQVEHPLDGLGFLTPVCERRAITGALFCSTMFPGRAPDGSIAIAGYFGGARAPDLGSLAPEALVDLARQEFRDLLGARGEPVVARVRHWPLGLPQYGIGHGKVTGALDELSHRVPGLFVVGNYLRGVSAADCLGVARETAVRVDRFIAERFGAELERAAAENMVFGNR